MARAALNEARQTTDEIFKKLLLELYYFVIWCSAFYTDCFYLNGNKCNRLIKLLSSRDKTNTDVKIVMQNVSALHNSKCLWDWLVGYKCRSDVWCIVQEFEYDVTMQQSSSLSLEHFQLCRRSYSKLYCCVPVVVSSCCLCSLVQLFSYEHVHKFWKHWTIITCTR